MRDPFEYVYPLPAASPLDDIGPWIPLLLAAVDSELDNERVWAAEDADTALGYVQDLRVWLSEFDSMANTGGGTPIGSITAYGADTAPDGWLFCDGSAVSRETYAALWALLGVAYGAGDGSTTFNLPDLRRRAPVGSGDDWSLGDQLGAETHVLTVNELPSHSHNFTVRRSATGFGIQDPAQASNTGETRTLSTAAAGGDQAHNNMQPSLIVNFIIRAL